MMVDFSQYEVTDYIETDNNMKKTCECCGRAIKRVFIFSKNDEQVYVGTECTKTISLSKLQEKTLKQTYKAFKGELNAIKSLSKKLEYRRAEFGDSLEIVVKNEIKPYSNYQVKIYAPSRFSSDMYCYDTVGFMTDKFKGIL